MHWILRHFNKSPKIWNMWEWKSRYIILKISSLQLFLMKHFCNLIWSLCDFFHCTFCTYCFQILNENKAPEVRSNYKSQNREKLFMPCRQEVKEKAILDGIQVSTLAGNVQNVFSMICKLRFLVTRFLFLFFLILILRHISKEEFHLAIP